MKKNYITPETNTYEVKMEALLGINSISDTEAEAGSKGNAVNFGRGDSDWDED